MEEEKKEQENNQDNNNEEKVIIETPEEAKLKQELEETTDKFKRLMAEFDNYKKRNTKERENMYNSILADIISAFLPVMDNLEKAANANSQDEGYKQGIELVVRQFSDVLTANGLEIIETVGKTFDPELHEAVSSVTDENLGPQEIKEEFRKGYKIRGKVIRHAMVSVAN